jgi:hypothetical protein
VELTLERLAIDPENEAVSCAGSSFKAFFGFWCQSVNQTEFV